MSKHRHNIKEKRRGKQGFILREQTVGRNTLSLKTTGECFRWSDCIDSVAMQMVYVEMGGGGSREKGQKATNNKTCRHSGLMQMNLNE